MAIVYKCIANNCPAVAAESAALAGRRGTNLCTRNFYGKPPTFPAFTSSRVCRKLPRQSRAAIWAPHLTSNKAAAHAELQQQQEPPQCGNGQLCLSGDVAGAAAVGSYSSMELMRSLCVYSLCTSSFLVNNCEKLLAVSCRILGPRLTFWTIKNSFFKVFCGGENLEQIVHTLDKLKQRNLGAILDYAAEQKLETLPGVPACDTQNFDEAIAITKQTIDFAASTGERFVAIKVTAFGLTEPIIRFNTLILQIDELFAELAGIEGVGANGRPCPRRLGEAVVSEQQFVSTLCKRGVQEAEAVALFRDLKEQPGADEGGKGGVTYFQWSHRITPGTAGHEGSLRCLSKVLPVLSAEERSAYEGIRSRFFSVCEYAAQQERQPPVLLVDAEQSTLQAFIHLLTIEAQKKYNKGRVLISNTYQAYLKDTRARLVRDLELSQRFGFVLSLKLVRGAYVSMENKITRETGNPLQVHDSIEETHASYDACVRFLFENLKHCEIFLASHNAHSLEKAAQLLRRAESEMGPEVAQKVTFGQLYGMGDALSHGLAAAGFSVFKYLPFGPVEETIPYLVRRAQENGGMLGGARSEVRYLWQEAKRRLMGGKPVH
ncbi:proline dehydrogenase 1, mitochondrial [Cyclospora cayetanensis]|uniref:Proline dehydrogenase n=1 Tax=Cyclospora cayetanensis TaxID=88456 RepID=A0A6P6RSR0_9EIME|nr:proline dehydrogenase 1, mitochondrial [Cyclospora cayetanensis]